MICFSELTVWECKLQAATSEIRNPVSQQLGRELVAAHQEVTVPFVRLLLGFGSPDEVQEIVGVIQRVVVHVAVHVEGFQQLAQAVAFLNYKHKKF